MIYKKLYILWLLYLASFNLMGSDSLQFYINYGLANNAGLKAKQNAYMASTQMMAQAKGLPNPELTVGVFPVPNHLLMGNQVADFKIMQMFNWPGTLKAAYNQANEMSNAMQSEFSETRNALTFNIKKAYYQLYLLQYQVKITKNNIELLQTNYNAALVKYKASQGAANVQQASSNTVTNATVMGQISNNMAGMNAQANNPQSNSMAASEMQNGTSNTGLATILNMQFNIIEQQNNLQNLVEQQQQAYVHFNNLLNRNANTQIVMPDTLLPVFDTNIAKPDSISISQIPMSRMLQHQQNSLQYRLIQNKKMALPMVGVGLQYSVLTPRNGITSTNNGSNMLMPMFTISLPIYRKKYNAMFAETNYLIEENKQKYIETLNNIAESITQTKNNVSNASRRILLYTKQLSVIQQSLNLSYVAYSHSQANYTDIINLIEQQNNVKQKLTQAIVEQNIAYAEMQFILGK